MAEHQAHLISNLVTYANKHSEDMLQSDLNRINDFYMKWKTRKLNELSKNEEIIIDKMHIYYLEGGKEHYGRSF